MGISKHQSRGQGLKQVNVFYALQYDEDITPIIAIMQIKVLQEAETARAKVGNYIMASNTKEPSKVCNRLDQREETYAQE